MKQFCLLKLFLVNFMLIFFGGSAASGIIYLYKIMFGKMLEDLGFYEQ